MVLEACGPGGSITKRAGHNLAKARLAARLSQEELATRCGLSQVTISRYEAGEFMPKLSNQILIAATLLRPPSEVFGELTVQEMFDEFRLDEAHAA